MSKSPKGPLIELAGKTIAKAPCSADGCIKTVYIKVNKSGWPYYSCAHCTYNKTQSVQSAKTMLSMDGIRWAKGMKGVVREMFEQDEFDAEDQNDPSAEELDPEPEFEGDEPPAPSTTPEPKTRESYFDV